MVSVSRRARPLHFGQVASMNSGTFSSGDSPTPVNLISRGSTTGN